MKPEVPIIHGHALGLAPLAREHLGLTWLWRNEDDVRKWFHSSDIISWGNHIAWFERYLTKNDDLMFIITDERRDHAPIGQVGLYNLKPGTKTAEFGRCIIGDRTMRGKRCLEHSTKTLMDASKKYLGISTWLLSVIPENEKAIYIYKKLGFYQISNSNTSIDMRIDF